MNRYAVLLQQADTPPTDEKPRSVSTPHRARPEPSSRRSIPDVGEQPTTQSTQQSTRESTGRSASRLGDRSSAPSSNTTVERPKAFYITKRLDHRLDEAVRYYQEVHGIKKVDRSAIVNAVLDNDANWTDESLDLVVDRIISLLTSRLTD